MVLLVLGWLAHCLSGKSKKLYKKCVLVCSCERSWYFDFFASRLTILCLLQVFEQITHNPLVTGVSKFIGIGECIATNDISDNWLASKSQFEICIFLSLYGRPGDLKVEFWVTKDIRNNIIQSVSHTILTVLPIRKKHFYLLSNVLWNTLLSFVHSFQNANVLMLLTLTFGGSFHYTM